MLKKVCRQLGVFKWPYKESKLIAQRHVPVPRCVVGSGANDSVSLVTEGVAESFYHAEQDDPSPAATSCSDDPLGPLEDEEWVGCDGCLKWRKVPIGFQFDRNASFFCNMIEMLTCDMPEEEWDDDKFVADHIIDDRSDDHRYNSASDSDLLPAVTCASDEADTLLVPSASQNVLRSKLAAGRLVAEDEESDGSRRSKGLKVKIEQYDGSYDCLICGESVRGAPALQCSHCTSNPFHTACVQGSDFTHTCPSCSGKTVEHKGGTICPPPIATRN